MGAERRDRKVHPVLGAGTLIWEGAGMWMRFEPDSGPVWRFQWAMLGTGTPDYLRRSKRRKNGKDLEMTAEEENWMTIQTATGEVLSFRKEGAPPAPVVVPASQGNLAL